jgi:hypothetical protein
MDARRLDSRHVGIGRSINRARCARSEEDPIQRRGISERLAQRDSYGPGLQQAELIWLRAAQFSVPIRRVLKK